MSEINTKRECEQYTEQQIKLINIAMDNCFTIFDPQHKMSALKLTELIDSEMRVDYYITFFIVNTCELLEGENKLSVEMISKIGKYLREIKAKPKREKIFTNLAEQIRELALSFVPILENPDFLKLWGQLLEYGLEQKQRDIEEGVYEKEMEIIPNEPQQEEIKEEVDLHQDQQENDLSLKNNDSIILEENEEDGEIEQLIQQTETLTIQEEQKNNCNSF